MAERSGIVTTKGKPLTLVGNEVKVGERAPDFTVLDNDLNPTGLAVYKGKVLIIASVPSLDTPVCDLETRRFNQEAAGLSEDVVVLVISMDLPFAQKRWCGIVGADRVTTLSDHIEASFGTAYGLLIEETRLLARAVLVVGRDGVIRYLEIVKELGSEPDYDAALAAARELL
jgi:thiol peroxidase